MSCNCLLIRIDQRDINSSTGNTLSPNNTVYITGFNDCYGDPIDTQITEKGYYCYCVQGVEPILCDMSGYSYNISEGVMLLSEGFSLDPEVTSSPVIPNIYYYENDILVPAVYSTYYNSETLCTENNECCTACNTNEYCISETFNSEYDDTYTEDGFHNNNPYWVGEENGLFIYYSTGTTQWCLSTSLDGPCFLSGKSPCTSQCPDLLSKYFTEGICLTTTTTIPPCQTFDFEAIFDCDLPESPTPTPTPTTTPTPTLTPSSTNFCGMVDVEVSISSFTPTPTSTPTTTPTITPSIDRPCNFYGDVTFNTVNDEINCPVSKQFQDCYNGTMYYTTNNISIPTGGTITDFMVFNATVDGVEKCLSYMGVTTLISGVNNIVINSGPYGFSNLGGCLSCNPTLVTLVNEEELYDISFFYESPTPTPSSTPTPTPTPSSTIS